MLTESEIKAYTVDIPSDIQKLKGEPPVAGSATLFGIVVQAGTDSETGKPRIIIETDEQHLRDIRPNIIFKPCRIELLERYPVLPMPNVRLNDGENRNPTTRP